MTTMTQERAVSESDRATDRSAEWLVDQYGSTNGDRSGDQSQRPAVSNERLIGDRSRTDHRANAGRSASIGRSPSAAVVDDWAVGDQPEVIDRSVRQKMSGAKKASIAITALIVIGAFWLSFRTVTDLVIASGVFDPSIAWVWPLIVDGLVLGMTVAHVVTEHKFALITLIGGSILTTCANAYHALLVASPNLVVTNPVVAQTRFGGATEQIGLIVAMVIASIPPLLIPLMSHMIVITGRENKTDHQPANHPKRRGLIKRLWEWLRNLFKRGQSSAPVTDRPVSHVIDSTDRSVSNHVVVDQPASHTVASDRSDDQATSSVDQSASDPMPIDQPASRAVTSDRSIDQWSSRGDRPASVRAVIDRPTTTASIDRSTRTTPAERVAAMIELMRKVERRLTPQDMKRLPECEGVSESRLRADRRKAREAYEKDRVSVVAA